MMSAIHTRGDLVMDLRNSLDAYQAAYTDNFEYSLDNRLILNWYPERILRHARGSSLLELGLGHGYTTDIFGAHFDEYVIVEGSPEIIRQYRNAFPSSRADIRCAYFEDFVPDHLYDVIVMGFVLEHVEDPAAVLRRYRKYLRPGGVAFVAVPNSHALNKRIGQAAGLIDDLAALSAADLALGHRRLFTVQSLRDVAVASGYKVERVEGIFLKPITTQQLTALNLPENVLRAMLQIGIEYPELCVAILMQLGSPDV